MPVEWSTGSLRQHTYREIRRENSNQGSSEIMPIPSLGGPERHDFHDSSLVDIVVGPTLNQIDVILSTPSKKGGANVWRLRFSGVLRFEYETLGNGAGEAFPIEIYDVYELSESVEKDRWTQRLRTLADSADQSPNVHHVVLASSFYSGWGKNEQQDGINVLCRAVQIGHAPPDYGSHTYERPVIEAGEEEDEQ